MTSSKNGYLPVGYGLVIMRLRSLKWLYLEQKMDKISDINVTHCTNSRFVQPFRVEYKQDGKQRFWDITKVHDSVAILIYNKTLDELVFVKQFRPAVYMSRHKHLWEKSDVFTSTLSQKSQSEDAPPQTQAPSDTAAACTSGYGPGTLGLAYEMCAGIIDKGCSLEQIAKEEVLEETGYDVPVENIQKVNSYYSSVGHSGSLQTLFYCEVEDSMMVSAGGGNLQEGERIEVLHVPAKEAVAMMFNDDLPKSTGFCFALLWFQHFKANKT